MKLFTPPPVIQRVLDAYMKGRYGDVVHEIAQPVVRVVDATLGTNLQNCESCASRRQRWNGEKEAMPQRL